MVGKQSAEAPESSAAWTVLLVLVLIGPKVTLSVVLLTGLTCIALLVFKTDAGVFVDIVDREESDDPAVVTVPQKSEFGARLQDPGKRLNGIQSGPKMHSWKRASISDFSLHH